MTVSLVPLLKGKLDVKKGGKGMKWVLAQVTLEPSVEALRPNAKWLDMKSLKAVYMTGGPTIGSQFVAVNLVGPGSVGNYASFVLYRVYQTNAVNDGTAILEGGGAATGTMTKTMLIIGE